MNITVKQNQLSKALGIVSKAASSKPTMPILSNILISQNASVMTLYATDLEIGIKVKLDVQNSSDVEDVTVNARLITEFVNSLVESDVLLKSNANMLELSNDNSKADFTTLRTKDFPKITDITELTPICELNPKDLSDAIHKVIVAVSTDNSRAVLTGALFEFDAAKLTIVSIDGYRLSKIELSQEGLNYSGKIIIPSRILSEVSKISSENSENVKFYLIKKDDKITQCVFEIGNIQVISRIIEGEYPDYNAIIPSESNLSFKMDKLTLSSALKTADTFARNIIGNKTVFSVNGADKRLTLKVTDPERGILETHIDIFDIEGEDMITAFNGRFLSDMVTTHVNSEVIIFKSKAPGLPSEFIAVENPNYLHIIMPMKSV